MLGLKPEHYLYLDNVGKELLRDKDMFLSNKCISSFMGYANQQMYRLQQKSLVAMSDEDYNAHIVKTLNGMRETLENQHKITGLEVKLKDGKIVLDLFCDFVLLSHFLLVYMALLIYALSLILLVFFQIVSFCFLYLYSNLIYL